MDVILYGHNETPNIVAVQQLNEQQVRIYRRDDGKVSSTDAEFFPFFFLSQAPLIEGFNRRFWLKELAGSNFYHHIAAFSRWNDMWEAVRFVLNGYNKTALKRANSYTETDILLLRPDPITQYLLQSGVTLFKGMTFSDVHRMQISLQTFSKTHRPSNPRRTEDRILVIALSDNQGWERTLDARQLAEPEMLTELVNIIREKDPDIIEGHNLYGQNLPYLLKRCELHSIDFAIGRDGSSVKSFSPRGGAGDRELENAFFEVGGRHLIDTMILAQTYDYSRRTLEGYSLRHLAQHFGFESKDRTFIRRENISTMWEENPAAVIRHTQDEVKEIRLVSEHLSPSYFFLAQMCPLSYTSITRTGSAVKIELLLLREYIRQKHSVPKSQPGTQTSGGYTDIFVTGVLNHVIHADIESLYPSIMLHRQIKPASDELNVFQVLLKDLTTKRLDAKREMRNATTDELRAKYDALQSSLKILINSFYGYLGYAKGLFNDYEEADNITEAGQELLRTIMKQVELYNGQVIEVDTDGLFFSPPDNVKGEEQESIFVEKISDSLPAGINLALAGRYKKMLSYKKKNYALLSYDDKMTIKGSSLVSRSIERFARNYIHLCINCLLQEDILGLHNLYVSFRKDITSHHWEAFDFARIETIHDSIEVYEAELRAEKRKPSAAYEVGKRAGIVLKPGDRVAYYVTGNHAGVKIVENCQMAEEWDPNFPDENTLYYLERLDEASEKFKVFFEPEDFKKVFSSDDLFGFSAERIKIVNKYKGPFIEPPPSEEESPDLGIWLDSEKGDL